MASSGKCIVTVFAILFIIFGLGFLALGIWMEVDKYVISYFIILQRSVTDEVLVAAPPIMSVIGLFLVGMGILGLFALSRRSRVLLAVFAFVLILILLLELVVGFTVVVFKNDFHKTVKSGMKRQLSEDYQFENTIGKAWNFVQVRHRCCGVDDGADYRESAWFWGMNPSVQPDTIDDTAGVKFVPNTCCVLNFNQDRDVTKVDPQDVQPKGYDRCQEDAAGNKFTGDYIHGHGCYVKALNFITDHFIVIICFGLGFGVIQLFGIITTCGFMRSIGKEID